MKTEYATKSEKLNFFRSLYESAKLAARDTQDKLEGYMRQYRGSSEIDGSSESALTVRNITYEMIESQISSDIPAPKVEPEYYSEGRLRNAHTVERLCYAVRDRLPFAEINDLDERYTYIYGGSVFHIEWDNTKYEGGVGGVKIQCISPLDFLPQPGIYSVDDMEYCFLRLFTTRGELCRKYGVTEAECERAECELEYDGAPPEVDTVCVVICYYRDERGEVGQIVFSGELLLIDIPSYYKRKIKLCKKCGMPEDACLCKTPDLTTENQIFESISKRQFTKYGILDKVSEEFFDGDVGNITYYTPNSFPIVVRKNTSIERSLYGQSDCEYIRPEQQAINKIESRILQKLLRAGITPIMPEDARVTLNNSVFGQVIKMKPGESAAQYGKVDTTPNIAQDIAEAERLYDHSKRILGISDAYQGIDMNSSESGYAKQLRISQAAGRLNSKKKMKHTAYAALDRKIFEHYLAFADEPRAVSYRDAFGRIQSEEFNRYSFIEYDARCGEYYYDDSYLFTVDTDGGEEYARESLWERNLENLKSGTLGKPDDPKALLRYWQCQERAHYPYAKENVEYFTEIINKDKEVAYENGII